MSRRSTPQHRIDDAAFPVRLVVCVPENGFGRMLDDISIWLSTNVGRGRYASHSAGRRIADQRIVDACAYYFLTAQDAAAFVEAFPLVLADGTTAESYTSPHKRPLTGR